MFLMVKVRVSPGLRFGSPVSPMLASSPTLSPPLATDDGGSPPNVIGNLSNGVSVFNTTASCSIVPAFLTTNVTSPGAPDRRAGDVRIGPPAPLQSLKV